jgi:hypothetical protein
MQYTLLSLFLWYGASEYEHSLGPQQTLNVALVVIKNQETLLDS